MLLWHSARSFRRKRDKMSTPFYCDLQSFDWSLCRRQPGVYGSRQRRRKKEYLFQTLFKNWKIRHNVLVLLNKRLTTWSVKGWSVDRQTETRTDGRPLEWKSERVWIFLDLTPSRSITYMSNDTVDHNSSVTSIRFRPVPDSFFC